MADASGAADTPGARANLSKWVLWANASLWPAVESSRKIPPPMLACLESILVSKPFLLGDKLTVADIAVGSYLHYSQAFFGEKFLTAPAVARYVKAIQQRPAFAQSIGNE